MKIITGESIQNKLNELNIKADFIRFYIAPQIVKYYFKLKHPEDIKKALKIDIILENWSGQKIKCFNESGYFCITTPTPEREPVSVTEFKHLKNAPPYSAIIGVSEDGEKITKTLDELTHLLVAGTTGSGKSVCLNSIIMSLCCYNKPEDLGVILIDPKQVEFNIYKNLPHLIEPVITESEHAEAILTGLVYTMEQRYKKLQQLNKQKNDGEFKKIVVVIDELADLILSNKNIKDLLIKLLQKGRASGIHFIIATQSPRASILNGLILANLPSRLALTCASSRESLLILGHKGAEQLTGKGDAIIKTPNSINETRIQIPLITQKQIKKLINN